MNDEHLPSILEEVRHIRELLELLAEPAMAQRDVKLRQELRKTVGSSAKKQKSVFLMDGSRTQKEIVAQTGVHQGHFSTMVGTLAGVGVLTIDKKHPKLTIPIPSNFFDADARSE